MSADFGPQVSRRSGRFGPELLHTLDVGTDVMVLPVAPAADGVGLTLPSVAAALPGLELADLARRESASGAAGEITRLTLPQRPAIVLFGTGDGGSTALRRAGAAVARATAGFQRALLDIGPHAAQAGPLVEGLMLASYRPPRTGIDDGPKLPLAAVELVGEVAEQEVSRARVAARATCRARLLAATPSNIKTPAWMAEQALALVGQAGGRGAGLSATVYDEAWIAKTGLRALAAVGAGSATPPRLVVVDYHPRGASSSPVLLVGKGITFDSGGISIKPREAMITMKTDMSGAAIVLATTLAAAELALPRRVVAVLPLAENAFSGSAYRPGDVIRCYDGTTVEIGNTDAEGRMVLADAMSWGVQEFAPSVLIDVATLTGAASLGLGRQYGALYATDQALTQGLAAAGAAAGEVLWPMPLVDEYRPALKSTIADLSHIATDSHVGGGSITAALFLQHFTGGTDWAHLDIAGPGRATKDLHEITAGPTGFSARALLGWLASV
ncbi:MAG: leucyl aminopeptidase family protein [Beutenbergiaceae bacterium]